jgi:hypothetical protein
MKKTTMFVVAFIMLLLASSCFAFQPAVIGGIRDGLALGLMMESGPLDGAKLRLGFEAKTSNEPGIVFVGGKWFLNHVNHRVPMFVSGGLVGYLGNNAKVGPYISLIFERFIDVMPLFLEVGIDVVDHGSLQFQIGYYF